MLAAPPPKFKPGMLVVGVPYASEHMQYAMKGIILRESQRSNWWGDTYTRWYEVLTETGKIVDELEKYLDAI